MGQLNKTTAQVQAILNGETQLNLNTQALAIPEINVTRSDVFSLDLTANTGQDVELNQNYIAFKFTPETDIPVLSFGVYAKKTGTITNPADYINMWMYTDNAGVPGTKIGAIQEAGRFGYLEDAYKIVKTQTTNTTLTAGTSYWLVIYRSAAPNGGSVYLDSKAEGTGNFATSTNGTTWTASDGKAGRFIIYAPQVSAVVINSKNYPAIDVYCDTEYGIRATSLFDYAGLFIGNLNGGLSATSIHGPGVIGTSTNLIGVYGISTNREGVFGLSTNGDGVYGSASGATKSGVYGLNSAGYGVYGQSISNYGIRGRSTSGVGGYFSSNTSFAGEFYIIPTAGDSVAPAMRLLKFSSNTPSAGTGISINFSAYNAGSQIRQIGEIGSTFLDLTNGAEKSNLVFKTNNSGTVATRFTINPDGTQKHTQLTGALTDGAPTAAEIEAITGVNAATAGAGYKTTIKDSNGTRLLYFIESDGTNWFYTVTTQAA